MDAGTYIEQVVSSIQNITVGIEKIRLLKRFSEIEMAGKIIDWTFIVWTHYL